MCYPLPPQVEKENDLLILKHFSFSSAPGKWLCSVESEAGSRQGDRATVGDPALSGPSASCKQQNQMTWANLGSSEGGGRPEPGQSSAVIPRATEQAPRPL